MEALNTEQKLVSALMGLIEWVQDAHAGESLLIENEDGEESWVGVEELPVFEYAVEAVKEYLGDTE